MQHKNSSNSQQGAMSLIKKQINHTSTELLLQPVQNPLAQLDKNIMKITNE